MTSKVVFQPSGIAAEIADQPTVLELARRSGVDLDSVCSGRGICGRCQISAPVGQFPKWGIDATETALSQPGPTEQNYRGVRALSPGRRLGCAARILGDAVIDIPTESQRHRQVVRKGLNLDGRPLRIDPAVVAIYLEPAPADLDGPPSASALIQAAWTASGRPGTLQFRPPTLAHLRSAIDAGGLTLVCEANEADSAWPTVCAVYPGLVESLLGVAIDLGSTTIAGHLVDLFDGTPLASAGIMNPQIRFGEDLMSRVSYVMMNSEGLHELTHSARAAVAQLTDQLVASAAETETAAETAANSATSTAASAAANPGLARRSAPVQQLTIVGNPIMVHLLLGLDPTPLGTAPFVGATTDAVMIDAAAIGVDVPMAQAYVLPSIAGHVGADAVAAVLATEPPEEDGPETTTGLAIPDAPATPEPPVPSRPSATRLVVDVGTNAELVLIGRDCRLAASSPTGPAFEGAQLSSGQRAAAGSVERVRIDSSTLEPRFRVIGVDAWSDETGFSARIASVPITGICGSGVIELIAELFLAGAIAADGTIRAEGAQRSPRVVPDGRTFKYVLVADEDREIALTQNDVRAIQLAKAALRAGIDLLFDRAGMDPMYLNSVELAGAFGAHIDPLYALVLGLIPDLDLARIHGVGNAAGNGAVRALLSTVERARGEQIARDIVRVETAVEPRFQELFVAAIPFPHAHAATPELERHLDLPPRVLAEPNSARGGRRRRRPTTAEHTT